MKVALGFMILLLLACIGYAGYETEFFGLMKDKNVDSVATVFDEIKGDEQKIKEEESSSVQSTQPEETDNCDCGIAGIKLKTPLSTLQDKFNGLKMESLGIYIFSGVNPSNHTFYLAENQKTSSGDEVSYYFGFFNDQLNIISVKYKGSFNISGFANDLYVALNTKYGKEYRTIRKSTHENFFWKCGTSCYIELLTFPESMGATISVVDQATQDVLSEERKKEKSKMIE